MPCCHLCPGGDGEHPLGILTWQERSRDSHPKVSCVHISSRVCAQPALSSALLGTTWFSRDGGTSVAGLSIHHQPLCLQISLHLCNMAGPPQAGDRQAADYLVQETCWFLLLATHPEPHKWDSGGTPAPGEHHPPFMREEHGGG